MGMVFDMRFWEQVRTLEDECEHLRARCEKAEAILRKKMQENGSFAAVVDALKHRERVRRESWPAGAYMVMQHLGEGDDAVEYPCVITAEGERILWAFGLRDIMAEDWKIIEWM